MTETQTDFAALAEPHRRELLAHCYRMTGRRDDAEDLVQQTYERAWRAYPGFAGRSSMRTWLYRIATNVCLDSRAVDGRNPVQPLPDDAVIVDERPEPSEAAVRRESIRFALVIALRVLPPVQRAAFVLRDVLGFSAAETAGILDTSEAAVKSALQRARARLAESAPARDEILEPDDPRAIDQLNAYVRAFETADVPALERVLRADVALDLPYSNASFDGLSECLTVFEAAVGAPGAWRMTPTTSNGQPAVFAWARQADGDYAPFGMAVLTPTSTGLARVCVFEDAALVAAG